MYINLYQDQMQKAFLFGTAVLYSEKPILREDVPQYWHGYELRGAARQPDRPCTLVDQADKNFVGSILSPLPQTPIGHMLRPASPDEAGLFFVLPPEKNEELGAIGHVRIDFGYKGREFWHTWWPRGPEELNTPEFKAELDKVVTDLRLGALKDLASMRRTAGGGKTAPSQTGSAARITASHGKQTDISTVCGTAPLKGTTGLTLGASTNRLKNRRRA